MDKNKIIYGLANALVCATYFGSAIFALSTGELVRSVFGQLDYPVYLVSVLIVSSLAANLAILVRKPVWLSDLAYSGMFWHLLLVISAHVNVGGIGFIPAMISLGAVLVSFLWQNKARDGAQSPYALPRADRANSHGVY